MNNRKVMRSNQDSTEHLSSSPQTVCPASSFLAPTLSLLFSAVYVHYIVFQEEVCQPNVHLSFDRV